MVDCQCHGTCAYHFQSDTAPQLFAEWHENRFWESVVLLTVFFLIYIGFYFLPEQAIFWLTIGAFTLVFGGAIADHLTTMANQRLMPEYDKRGLECPYYEANPLLPRRVTQRTMIFSWPTLVHILMLPVIWFVPAVGYLLGLGSLRASYSNLRWNRFLKADLAYHDRQQYRGEGV